MSNAINYHPTIMQMIKAKQQQAIAKPIPATVAPQPVAPPPSPAPVVQQTAPPATQNVPNIQNDATHSRDYMGALLGLGQSGASAFLQGGNGWQTIRRREKEVDEALSNNVQDRDRILNATPEATRRAQAAQLNQGKSQAVQAAANVGAGMSSSAGLSGGDTNSAVLSAVKASAPVMQASAGYDSQLSQNFAGRDQADANINQQAMGNTMMRGQLAEMTNYTDRENQSNNQWASFAANATNSALNGVNALDNFKTMGDQKNTVANTYIDPADGKLYYTNRNGQKTEYKGNS